MSDQHNAQVMGCAGDSIVHTPNLDRLARQGMRFTEAHTSAPICVPARMGFLTGCYPSTIRNWANRSILPTHTPTFAHGLGGAGYETALCGKMHFAGPDQFHGFERRLVGECETDRLYDDNWLHSPGTGNGKWNGTGPYPVQLSGAGWQGYQAYDRHVGEVAARYLTEKQTGNRPFCLVVGFISPHNPYVCRQDLFDHYFHALPRLTRPELASLPPKLLQLRKSLRLDEATDEEFHRARAAYYGLVTEMDENIGRVLAALDANPPLQDNTIIIYTSDHGDMIGEKGLWYKMNFMNASVKIPLLVKGPGIPSNAVSSKIVSLIDLAPTLLEFGGAKPLPKCEGRNLRVLLDLKSADSWYNQVFAEEIGSSGRGPSLMIRKDQWKFIYYHQGAVCELYNEEEDPQENNNLADDPGHASHVKSFLETTHSCWSGEFVEREFFGRQRPELPYVENCGHELIPHSMPTLPDFRSEQRFDLSQLPHIPEHIDKDSLLKNKE